MSKSIVIQRPDGLAAQLILLFHGAGAQPRDMVPLGQYLARAFPNAFVVSVVGPKPSDAGSGYQWFPVRGVTQANRPDRVKQAMPRFVETVQRWQARSGVGAAATALIGFSQCGIMALEYGRRGEAGAGRIVSIGGRFAQLPDQVAADTTFHFIHGKRDDVIPYAHAVMAAERLVAIGADVTADVIPFVGHEVNEEVMSLLLERLQGYIPRRAWQAAMRADPQATDEDGYSAVRK